MTIVIESFIESSLRDLLAEAISLELQTMEPEAQATILAWTKSLNDSGLYQFFSKASLESIVSFVADELSLRQYVLSLHERFMVLHAMSSGLDSTFSVLNESISTITQVRHDYQEEKTLLPNGVSNALYIDTHELNEALQANPWLVTLYLTLSLGAFRLASNYFFKDL